MANNKVVNYIQESYDELMHKVSWPTFTELQSSSIVVSVASLIIASVVFLIDKGFSTILHVVYSGQLNINWFDGVLVVLFVLFAGFVGVSISQSSKS